MQDSDSEDKTRTYLQLAKDTIVGHYRIIERIGAGGMGEVYLAEDTELNRKVALKFLPHHLCQDADCRARFKREAQAAAKLSHPNIITVHEVTEYNDRPFFVMEYLQGRTLKEIIEIGDMSLRTALELSAQVCEGLAKAHRGGIVHRDIKPANIIVDADGRARILDFGLAAVKGGEKITKAGSTMGTVGYMSPEQVRGEELDARSDIFSIGVVLYEMITGRLPFAGDHEPAVFYAIQYEEPEPLARYKSGISDELQKIVNKALSKDRRMRYQRAEDLCGDLENLNLVPSQGHKDLFSRARSKKAYVLSATATLFLLLISVLGVYHFIREKREFHIPSQRQLTFVGDANVCAVSPDGTYIAYGAGPQGKIRILVQDLRGGDPLQVLECEYVRFLHWSPSGSELLIGAMVDSEYPDFLVIPRLGGTFRKYLTPKEFGRSGFESASWSPDGSLFAAQSGFSGQPLAIVNKRSGEISQVPVNGPPGWLKEVVWSPKGDRLFFRVVSATGTTYWTMRPDGTELRSFSCGEGYSYRWSPRGDALYYLTSMQASTSLMKQRINPDDGSANGEPEQLLSGLQTDGPISLSADGKKLVYPRNNYSSNLWYVPAGTSGRADSMVQLTSGTAVATDPAISPDGKQIAFVISESGEKHIYSLPMTGGAKRRLTFSTPVNFCPAWSLDGKRIAFACWHNGAYRLAIMNADGGDIRYFDSSVFTSVPLDKACSWGSGHSVLFQEDGNRNFNVLDIETGAMHQLVANDSAGWLFSPVLSPDHKSFAVYWNRSLNDKPPPAGRGIWTMATDGTDQKMVFHNEEVFYPLRWSPDGRAIYAYAAGTNSFPAIELIPIGDGPPKEVTQIRLPNVRRVVMSPDGNSFVCSVSDNQIDIWIVEDFDPDIE